MDNEPTVSKLVPTFYSGPNPIIDSETGMDIRELNLVCPEETGFVWDLKEYSPNASQTFSAIVETRSGQREVSVSIIVSPNGTTVVFDPQVV